MSQLVQLEGKDTTQSAHCALSHCPDGYHNVKLEVADQKYQSWEGKGEEQRQKPETSEPRSIAKLDISNFLKWESPHRPPPTSNSHPH